LSCAGLVTATSLLLTSSFLLCSSRVNDLILLSHRHGHGFGGRSTRMNVPSCPVLCARSLRFISQSFRFVSLAGIDGNAFWRAAKFLQPPPALPPSGGIQHLDPTRRI
jgi:hypothetical protein